MAGLYRYVKETSYPAQSVSVVLDPARLVSTLLMCIGAGMIAWVAWPIISFKLLAAPQFGQILAPVPEPYVRPVLANTGFAEQTTDQTEEEKTTEVDYTKASNWFPQLPQQKSSDELISYSISIPKLGIEGAKAVVGGEDLSKSLIHYGGTALPGEYGTAVIFGHSTLPYFFDPNSYTKIFSTLPDLRKGDQIYVDYDGLRYKYVIYEMTVVKPKDIQILEQRYDDSYLTLVTCVPPGTYLERLVVKARLQKM